MLKIKIGMLIILATMAVNNLFAQGESAVPFLLIAPNSRNSAMGETGAGLINDATAMFWNPAGLAFQKGVEVNVTHSPWLPGLGLGDLFFDFLSGKYELKKLKGTVGVSITYLNIGQIIQTDEFGNQIGQYQAFDGALAVGYGTKVIKDLGVGVVARFIYSKLEGQQTVGNEKGKGIAFDMSFDISALWKPSNLKPKFLKDRLGLGFNFSNLGPKVTYIDNQQADPLPSNLRIGLAYDLFKTEFNNLTITLDESKLIVKRNGAQSDPLYKAMFTTWTGGFNDVMKSFQTSIGAEYWYGNPRLIGLRGGWFYEDPNHGNRKFLTLGAGLRYSLYGFDFSYVSTSDSNSPLANTLRFTLSINFGGSQKTTQNTPPKEGDKDKEPKK